MAMEDDAAREPGTLAEAVLGRPFLQSDSVKPFMRFPPATRAGLVAAAFAALIFVPYLGAVGLWDPWETHYGEVAREMIQRNDYLHPYWENAWFFSKPAFAMWMMALGMRLTGSGIAAAPNTSNDPLVPGDALGLWTEWGFRLPFAVFSILGVGLLAYALARVTRARVGLSTAFVLVTMPLYFLISRQAVTDTPMIAANLCAMACAIVALIDTSMWQRERDAWWMGFWVFVSFGTLAKESLGVAPIAVVAVYVVLNHLPTTQQAWQEHLKWVVDKAVNPAFAGGVAGAVAYGLTAFLFGANPNPLGHYVGAMPGLFVAIAVFLVLLHRAVKAEKTMPSLWAELFRMRLGTGILVFLAVAIPWYWVMFSFPQVDDEGKLFWFRVLVHDNFGRLASGVHTTTPGGSFTYFIEQGGFATFPWSLAVPGALAVVARLTIRGEDPHDKVGVIGAAWLAGTFVVIGASATKFHHYVLPMLPPLAILIGLFIDKLWSEGVAKHGLSLLLGLPFFVLVGKDLAGNPKNFTDLFVYNYDRPYPFEMVQNPINSFQSRPLWISDLLAVALLGIGGYLFFESVSAKRPAPLKGLAVTLAALGAAATFFSLNGGRTSGLVYFGLAFGAGAAWFFYESTRSKDNQLVLYACALVAALPGLAFLTRGVQVESGRGNPQAGQVTDFLQPLLTDAANIKEVMGFSFIVGGALLASMALARARVAMFSTGIALITAWALWFNWSHWVQLTHHWTQRDQFWRYFAQRRPGEPITAFLMNWRGETFYSRNTVKQIKDNNLLYQYAQQPGREWALVEHNRLGILKGAVGPDKQVTLVEKDLNNKFVLVTIE
jgi:4-amino-4-deoxy-L-arabinose transferase-like glycosyltransferase